MQVSNQSVNISGSGVVIQGNNITAGGEITINHFTEIRQATEELSARCGASKYTSNKVIACLEVLSGTAEFTEDYARKIQAEGNLSQSHPYSQTVVAECTSISSELQRLIAQVDHPGTGESDEPNGLIVCPYPEDIIDLRNRLMGAQVKLSQIHNMQFAEDLGAIKKAVLEIVNSVTDSEDASSIRTFYTACSVPYVERSMWREVEQTLRTRFSPQCVQDHYALIIETIEASLSENLQQSEVTPTITSLFTPEQFQVIVREFVQKHVQLPISFEAIVERCIDITTLPKEMMTVTPPKRREKLFYFRVMEVATIRTIEFLQGVQPAYLHGLGLRSKSDREETLQSCRKRLAQIDALIGDDVLKMKVREKSVLPSNCQCIVSVTAECNFCRFPISLMYSKIIYHCCFCSSTDEQDHTLNTAFLLCSFCIENSSAARNPCNGPTIRWEFDPSTIDPPSRGSSANRCLVM